MQDVDAGDGVEGNGDVEIEVAGFGIVDAQAVDEDEGLLEGGAADGEVGLDAFAAARLDIERRVGAEEVDDAVGAEGHLAGLEHLNGAIALGERQRLDGGGHLDAVDYNELYGWEDRAALRGGSSLLRRAGRSAGLGSGAGGLLG